jgi:hypothetical protein
LIDGSGLELSTAAQPQPQPPAQLPYPQPLLQPTQHGGPTSLAQQHAQQQQQYAQRALQAAAAGASLATPHGGAFGSHPAPGLPGGMLGAQQMVACFPGAGGLGGAMAGGGGLGMFPSCSGALDSDEDVLSTENLILLANWFDQSEAAKAADAAKASSGAMQSSYGPGERRGSCCSSVRCGRSRRARM